LGVNNDDEIALIATGNEKRFIDDLSLGDGSNKRYQLTRPLVIYIKNGIDYRDANELASALFFNYRNLANR